MTIVNIQVARVEGGYKYRLDFPEGHAVAASWPPGHFTGRNSGSQRFSPFDTPQAAKRAALRELRQYLHTSLGTLTMPAKETGEGK